MNAPGELSAAPSDKPDPALRKGIGMSNVFGYIYTSGTTGLPKAAVILHYRMVAFGNLMMYSFHIRETDIVYT